MREIWCSEDWWKFKQCQNISFNLKEMYVLINMNQQKEPLIILWFSGVVVLSVYIYVQ